MGKICSCKQANVCVAENPIEHSAIGWISSMEADRSVLRTCIQVTLKRFISGWSRPCQLFLILSLPDLVHQHEFKCLTSDAHVWKIWPIKTIKLRTPLKKSGWHYSRECIKRITPDIWMKISVFSLVRNIFVTWNILINMKYLYYMKYHSLCCDWFQELSSAQITLSAYVVLTGR